MAGIQLKRSLNLPLILLYGLGNILGAGIYVLVGKVAGVAGIYAPMAFVVASAIATITALCYAELSSRYPLSAGEAVYLQHGFGYRWLSTGVGLLICFSVLVSSATLIKGFTGYLQVFITVPETQALIITTIAICTVALLTVTSAVGMAAILTLIEIGGLIFILFVGADYLDTQPIQQIDLLPPASLATWTGVFTGAFLAFYAFLGFEDMVNVAEEVKNPQRNMPLAIFLALGIATAFYFAVSFIAISIVAPAELAHSNAPLALVYETASGKPPVAITLISLFAIINGALIQIIMVSRMLYGMSMQGWLPVFFSYLSPGNQTPTRNTILAASVVLGFALWLPIVTLAKTTSFSILIVFALVCTALFLVKRKNTDYNGTINYPQWVPIAGAIASLCLITVELI